VHRLLGEQHQHRGPDVAALSATSPTAAGPAATPASGPIVRVAAAVGVAAGSSLGVVLVSPASDGPGAKTLTLVGLR